MSLLLSGALALCFTGCGGGGGGGGEGETSTGNNSSGNGATQGYAPSSLAGMVMVVAVNKLDGMWAYYFHSNEQVVVSYGDSIDLTGESKEHVRFYGNYSFEKKSGDEITLTMNNLSTVPESGYSNYLVLDEKWTVNNFNSRGQASGQFHSNLRAVEPEGITTGSDSGQCTVDFYRQ